MDLLNYTFFYLLAAVLVFQGTHAFGEISEPMGVVPEEVAQAPDKARIWGGLLAGYGYMSLLAALLSHGWVGLQPLLAGMMALGLGLMAAYGFYLIFFSRKVEYRGAPSPTANHDSH